MTEKRVEILLVEDNPDDQGDSSATRHYEGAGLGLYIVRWMPQVSKYSSERTDVKAQEGGEKHWLHSL